MAYWNSSSNLNTNLYCENRKILIVSPHHETVDYIKTQAGLYSVIVISRYIFTFGDIEQMRMHLKGGIYLYTPKQDSEMLDITGFQKLSLEQKVVNGVYTSDIENLCLKN